MKPAKFARLKQLLLESSDLPEEERQNYLHQACGDDGELLREAELILAQGAEDSAILKEAGDVPESALQPGDEALPLPEKIGQYVIKRIIASGGMGVVYEALQENPQRTVALKVMRTGIASKSALRRFEYESQLLARLTHPGIAQVYEAGTHDDGSGAVPYFAMEYVPDALPVTKYAEEKKLGTRERLELSAQVCDAVHHGHQKGIIHRDLKPGNILVNADGRVKVIDFGVARSTDSDVALTTLQTGVGQLIGTLQYMSPEQCAADPNDIDTRSDVYALGVVQYELLCGRLPYDVKEKAFHEVTRVIREEPPTRPGTISRQLRGDVETITLKALEKDRARRYQSAVELAQDIRRYLSGEAIIGRPPSMIYQLQIFARRHRAIFVSLIAILVVLAVGLAVSSTMYLQAEQAREETAQERDRALAAEKEAEKRRAEAEAVTTFLSDTLAAVDPSEAQGKEVTIREMLDKAAEKIDEAFSEQPLVEAALRTTIGNTYSTLGEYATAERHLEAALEIRDRELGEKHSDTLNAMSNLADLYIAQSRHNEADPLQTRILELRRHLRGEEHPDTLDTLESISSIWFNQGRSEESVQLLEHILEVRCRVQGVEHTDTLESMLALSGQYSVFGRNEEAEALALRALEVRKRLLGEEHPDTMQIFKFLCVIYYRWNRLDEAQRWGLRDLDYCRSIYGEEHPKTLSAMDILGTVYMKQEKYEESKRMHREAHEHARRVLGEEHDLTLVCLDNLGWAFEAQGRYNDAKLIYQRVLESRHREFGENNIYTLSTTTRLARVFMKLGRYDEAESLLIDAVPRWKQHFSGTSLIGRSLNYRAVCLLKTGRYIEAEAALLESLELSNDLEGADSSYTLDTVKLLVELYDTWGKPDEAIEWREKLPDPVPESESDRFP